MGPGSSRPDSFPLGSWDPAPRRRLLSRGTRTSWVRRTHLPLSINCSWGLGLGGGGRQSGWQRCLLRLPRSPCGVPALSSRSSLGASFGLQASLASEGHPAPGRAAGQGEGPGHVGAARSLPSSRKRREHDLGAGGLTRPLPGTPVHLLPVKTVFWPRVCLATRENEVEPSVDRVGQRDLLCGDLLALSDAGPRSLGLPHEPVP